MKRRVLHLIPRFGAGGAERQLGYLSPGLVARRVDVLGGLVSQESWPSTIEPVSESYVTIIHPSW